MSSTKILATFNELTKSLTLSKESIGKATKFAMENTNAASDLILVLLRRMKKLPIPRRLPVFYLVDSICQNSHQKGSFPFIDAICAKLPNIVELVFPSEWPETEVEEKKKILSSVNKVLTLWDVRQILPGNIVEEAQKQLDANYSTKRKPNSIQEQLSKMEEFRRENKRQRWEAKLRPQNEDVFAEFGEMWQKASPEEQATPVKNPLSSSLSPMSPFLSPPSPSPFSPLSPSSPYNPHSPANHARKNIAEFEFQKPKLPESRTSNNERFKKNNDVLRQPQPLQVPLQVPQQLPDNLYSPSSPTSSPENPQKTAKFVFVWDLESLLLCEPSIRTSSKAEIRLERVYHDINDIIHSNSMVQAFDAEISEHNFKNQSPVGGVPRAVIEHFPELRELCEGKQKDYEILSSNLDKDSETWLDVDDLLDDADYYSDGKSVMAKKLFKHISTRPDAVNLVLTSGNLTRALIKLVGAESFGTYGIAGNECFNDLAAKFSPKSRFAVLHDPSTYPEGVDLPKKEPFTIVTVKKALELDSLLGTVSKNIEKVFWK